LISTGNREIRTPVIKPGYNPMNITKDFLSMIFIVIYNLIIIIIIIIGKGKGKGKHRFV